jgi:hypothetical protein
MISNLAAADIKRVSCISRENQREEISLPVGFDVVQKLEMLSAFIA